MTYRIVFDVADAGYKSWSFPAIGVLLVAFGILFFRFRRAIPEARFPFGQRRLFFGVWLTFASLWTVIAFGATFTEYFFLRRALADGECWVVEGTVTDFVPVASNGKGEESFVVGTQKFAYSHYRVTAGFNQTQRDGGPMREGLHARIHHRGGVIARLEIE